MEQLEEENESLRLISSSVQKVFRPDQIHRLTSPGTRAPWSSKSLQDFIALKTMCGTSAYKYMYNKGYPFAHINTLTNHLSKIECLPGVLTDFIDLMELKVAEMPARNKYVALVIDEMTIQSKYVFDNHTQSFLGQPTIPCSEGVIKNRLKEDSSWDQEEALATHALNGMFHGLCESFKGMAGVEFTDNGFCPKAVAKWMKKMIQKAYDVGLIVRVIVMDMGGGNMGI